MLTLILGLYLLTPEAQLDLARSCTLYEDYETSNDILSKFKPPRAIYNEYHYYSAVNFFKLNDKQKAQTHLLLLQDTFSPTEITRHQAIIGLMERDILNWKKDDLGDISRDMDNSGNRLNNDRGGPKTQKLQQDILNKLDKLIKEKEDQANGKGNGQGEDKDGQEKNGKAQGKATLPASDSQIAGLEGKGKVDERQLRNMSQNWVKMTDRQRADAMAEVTRDLPPKYKVIIEDYFKALAKDR
jgi:hypothetical protein